ncbi:hypothetical protein [Cohnella sp. JJ-181]|uniref:hypothetical protein n=1 Tax=Cohnella rhizoplanae TaxID=2974897 RepID=UPI0022FF6972|nr:hypothetical protein [Cohnella sp. JJ-181]CAI6084681.1 hypothetical protein COHCIP112018_04417 [Cohnella sp. JJ-181]
MNKDRLHETQPEAVRDAPEENYVFNDATDHLNRIVGVPNRRADLSGMPAVVRWFFYLVVLLIAVGAVLLVLSIIIQ